MTQLWAWEYEGQDEVGTQKPGNSCVFKSAASEAIPILRHTDHITNLRKVKVVDEDAMVIDSKSISLRYIKNDGTEEITIKPQTPPVTKTYLTTDQFIKVWKSLDEPKQKELNAARYAAWDASRYAARYAAWDASRYAARNASWYAVWNAAWDADLAVLVKDKISDEHFKILTSPWTSCGLSLYAEDWDEVLNPKVTEPKGFGAIVGAHLEDEETQSARRRFIRYSANYTKNAWVSEHGTFHDWSDLINPTIISEGVE